jgi:hypothetical protein
MSPFQSFLARLGTTALKYSSETGTTRICRKIGDIFEQPENGWEDKIYYANISGANRKSHFVSFL